jgi:hypothetical protein
MTNWRGPLYPWDYNHYVERASLDLINGTAVCTTTIDELIRCLDKVPDDYNYEFKDYSKDYFLPIFLELVYDNIELANNFTDFLERLSSKSIYYKYILFTIFIKIID